MESGREKENVISYRKREKNREVHGGVEIRMSKGDKG